MVQASFMDQRPCDLPDPSMMFTAMAIVAPGRGLRRPALARAGATLAGRPVAAAGERVAFDPRSRPTWPLGFPDDAATIANAVKVHLGG